MKIAGLLKFSLIDYPGKICATLFTQGCNFCCPYCHNKALIDIQEPALFSIDSILKFLESKIGKLQAVCISGGEPTIHKNLPLFVKQVKELGYLIKLDTNGYNPLMLRKLLEENNLDFIAMDIKAPEEKYPIITGRPIGFGIISESIDLIKNSGIAHQFRTTFVKPLLSGKDITEIKSFLSTENSYVTQEYIPSRN